MNNQFFSKRFYFYLAIVFILSVGAVVFIPQIDRFFFAQGDSPSSFTFIGVGVALILFTAFLVYFGIKAKTGFTKLFLLYVFLYNALIVAAKFISVPVILYGSGEWVTYYQINQDNTFWTLSAFWVLTLYLTVFLILYAVFRRRASRLLAIDGEITPNKQGGLIAKTGWMISVSVVIWCVVGVIIIFLGFFSKGSMPLQYLMRILYAPFSILISLSLIASIYFVQMAFQSATDQAVIIRDVTILTSFFWIGAILIIMYHALWFVYLMTLTTLWPLAVVLPPEGAE